MTGPASSPRQRREFVERDGRRSPSAAPEHDKIAVHFVIRVAAEVQAVTAALGAHHFAFGRRRPGPLAHFHLVHDPATRSPGRNCANNSRSAAALQMHETPTDLKAVLRDYSRDMVLPSLEVYTEGVMTDRTMFDAFLAAENQGENHAG